MNLKIPKSQFLSTNKGYIIQIDYHSLTKTLIANTPIYLSEVLQGITGKKALVFAYQPGRNYGKVMDFGEAGAEDFLTGATREKRRAYLSRAMNIRDSKGYLTALDKYSPNYWAIKFLWEYTPRLNSKYISK